MSLRKAIALSSLLLVYVASLVETLSRPTQVSEGGLKRDERQALRMTGRLGHLSSLIAFCSSLSSRSLSPLCFCISPLPLSLFASYLPTHPV